MLDAKAFFFIIFTGQACPKTTLARILNIDINGNRPNKMKIKTNMVLLFTDAMSIQYNPGTNLEVYKRLVLRYVGLRLCTDDSKVIAIDACKVTDTKRQVLCYFYTRIFIHPKDHCPINDRYVQSNRHHKVSVCYFYTEIFIHYKVSLSYQFKGHHDICLQSNTRQKASTVLFLHRNIHPFQSSFAPSIQRAS